MSGVTAVLAAPGTAQPRPAVTAPAADAFDEAFRRQLGRAGQPDAARPDGPGGADAAGSRAAAARADQADRTDRARTVRADGTDRADRDRECRSTQEQGHCDPVGIAHFSGLLRFHPRPLFWKFHPRTRCNE